MIGGIFVMSHFGITPQIKEVFSKPQYTYQIGDSEITAYLVMKSIITAIIIFWLAAILSAFGERRIGKISRIRASSRVLFTKIFQIAIYIIAFLIGMDVIGIDLTTLTVFSGAVGIGLGFGLQKIASNFISGLILLMERAIEVGDLIELDGNTTGFVRKNSARHTLIETLEGREIMVPNEDFITNRVINWTYSNTKARIDVAVGVSYNSDLELVQRLITEAALEHPLCSKDPAPNCFLRNFNSSSVDFLLLFWVDDVTKGRWMPQSEVMFTIWKKFKENGVEIPFPQQDLHLVSAPGLNLVKNENIGQDEIDDA
ncbi:MAG: mechanosensitive ion channel protein MscS [Alphaproteobacteria bacterium]|nr:mechanosensitive ion channel protein MscS [Alphaproteobacteria bacterium]